MSTESERAAATRRLLGGAVVVGTISALAAVGAQALFASEFRPAVTGAVAAAVTAAWVSTRQKRDRRELHDSDSGR